MFKEKLYQWIIGDLGNTGDFAYAPIHFNTLVVVGLVLALALCLVLRWKKNKALTRNMVLAVAWFHLGFEMLWRVIYLTVRGSALKDMWPLYPCNLGGILLPVIAITGWKTGKKMFYMFGLVGSLITFAYPDGIYVRDVLSFPILKSILQHTGLLLIPVMEMAAGTYRPRIKDMGWVIAGCIVHLVNCEVVTRLLGFTGDYMFFRSGMPFVIPGVPQYITLSVFALLVLAGLSLLGDLAGRKQKVR